MKQGVAGEADRQGPAAAGRLRHLRGEPGHGPMDTPPCPCRPFGADLSRTDRINAVFAGIHLLNLLSPASDPLFALARDVRVFAIGVMYAEVFVRTRSPYLPILIHFLVNGTVDIRFHGLHGHTRAATVLGIPFHGLIPACPGICWRRLVRRGP